MGQYSIPRLDKREARITQAVVDGLNNLVALHGDDEPPHEAVARVCREAGMDSDTFYYLDSKSGMWSREGGWHAALRRLRNNAPRDVWRSAFAT